MSIESMESLIAEARRKKMWLRGKYSPVTMTPSEMESHCLDGRLEAEATLYWELFDPMDEMRRFEDRLKQAADDLEMFKIRVFDDLEKSPKQTVLTFDDAVKIAKGCFDYGGVYRADEDELEIFHHGIQTVINSLEREKDGSI